MKIGICNETFVDWPLDRAAAFARECGYTGFELAPFTLANDIHALAPKDRQSIRNTIEQAGLEVIGLHWLLAKTEGYHLTSRDPAVQSRTSDYFKTLAQLCRDVGGRVMVLGSPQQRNLADDMSRDEGMELASRILGKALPTLEQLDITLALEPLGPQEGNFLLTAEDGLELRSRLESDQVQLHLDVKAMSSESLPIPDVIRQGASHLAHFHANDPNRRGPGMGDVDFVPILGALQEVGYDGWISVEVFDYSPGVETLARESIANLREAAARLV